jgi:hypothetical protein
VLGSERALAGAATALKERERDDRDRNASLKSKVGEITMDNELLYRSRRWRVNALSPAGGRDDEPDLNRNK